MDIAKIDTKELGDDLARLRKVAGVTQAEIARKISVDASRISRIETGDFSPADSEIEGYLKAIKTDEAKRYLDFLRQNFRVLNRPPFVHPDREIICLAENHLQKIDDFRHREDLPGPLVAQGQMYFDTLLRSANYLLDLNHSVSYIGNLGVGKTTFICMQTSLVLREKEKSGLPKTVLETGGGGTTVCEVRIRSSSNYGIIVEPQPDSEIYTLVDEFCASLKDTSSSDGDPDQKKGVSREIERAIRNLAGLTTERTKGSDGKLVRKDPAVELTNKFPSPDELRSEISSRLRLWRRTRREIWHETASGLEGLEWLKRTFTEINNGRHSDFSLPRQIDIFVPYDLPSSNHFRLEFIDTKGVDQAAIRPDLQARVDDPRSIVVLCSSFNSAPDPSIQKFIEHLTETGSERTLHERVALLVLPRPQEAFAVKDDTGYQAETDEEGYDLKREQVEGKFQQIGARDIPIHFFNAFSDNAEPISEALFQKLNEMRSVHADRIKSAVAAIDTLIENQEEEYARAAQGEVNQSLSVYVEQHSELSAKSRQAHDAVLNAVRSIHARTVWATTRRNGTWGNLDVFYYLGSGAATDAKIRTRKSFEGLNELVENMLGQSDLEPAHKFLKELTANIAFWRENFLDAARRAGELTFRPSLEDNDEIWCRCETIYGQGRLFRQEVAEFLQHWFEGDKQQHLHDLLEVRIKNAWQVEVLEPLAELCNDN